MGSRKARKGDAKQAIGYCRVSTDDQALGVPAQRASIEAWAARAGVTIVAWHIDAGVSGAAPLDKRPALMAALDSLAELGAGVLAVAKRDRLARDVAAAAMIEGLAIRSGARVVSAAGEGSEGDDPASMLLRGMLDCFSQFERALIRSRTKAALAVKAARGERVGTVPYGYSLAADGRTLEANPAEQAVLDAVKAARARGLSLRAIVAELAAAGFVSRSGKPLALTQIARMAA